MSFRDSCKYKVWSHICMFMDKLEPVFLQTQYHQPFLWLRYIDNIFFIWTHGEKTENFLRGLYT